SESCALSLHDALPISTRHLLDRAARVAGQRSGGRLGNELLAAFGEHRVIEDRKSGVEGKSVDLGVTGVQTCALPISTRHLLDRAARVAGQRSGGRLGNELLAAFGEHRVI